MKKSEIVGTIVAHVAALGLEAEVAAALGTAADPLSMDAPAAEAPKAKPKTAKRQRPAPKPEAAKPERSRPNPG